VAEALVTAGVLVAGVLTGYGGVSLGVAQQGRNRRPSAVIAPQPGGQLSLAGALTGPRDHSCVDCVLSAAAGCRCAGMDTRPQKRTVAASSIGADGRRACESSAIASLLSFQVRNVAVARGAPDREALFDLQA
jgi:hypothetical protein